VSDIRKSECIGYINAPFLDASASTLAVEDETVSSYNL
jgi:hypothetical protein